MLTVKSLIFCKAVSFYTLNLSQNPKVKVSFFVLSGRVEIHSKFLFFTGSSGVEPMTMGSPTSPTSPHQTPFLPSFLMGESIHHSVCVALIFGLLFTEKWHWNICMLKFFTGEPYKLEEYK